MSVVRYWLSLSVTIVYPEHNGQLGNLSDLRQADVFITDFIVQKSDVQYSYSVNTEQLSVK